MKRNIFVVLTETELRLPYTITSIGGWHHQEPVLREEGFPDYQWIQCISGEGVLETEGLRLTVGPGQGMLLYPNRKHHYYAVRGPWEVQWVSFNGPLAGKMLESLQLTGSAVLTLTEPEAPLRRMLRIGEVLQSRDPFRYVQGSVLIYETVLDLFLSSSAPDARSKSDHYRQLAPALDYIDDHYAEPLSLAVLSDTLGVSPQYTCLLFQKSLGLRPFEYINRIRLRRAKELLLQEPSRDVKEIARAVGYEHSSYFIKLFKQQEGVTPSAFRRLHR